MLRGEGEGTFLETCLSVPHIRVVEQELERLINERLLRTRPIDSHALNNLTLFCFAVWICRAWDNDAFLTKRLKYYTFSLTKYGWSKLKIYTQFMFVRWRGVWQMQLLHQVVWLGQWNCWMIVHSMADERDKVWHALVWECIHKRCSNNWKWNILLNLQISSLYASVSPQLYH